MQVFPEHLLRDVSNISNFLKRYEEEKKIRVYYVRSTENDTGRPVYFYLVASALMHDKMLQCLRDGEVPDFAVMAAKGYDEPTEEVKAMVKQYYGFDHDLDETGDVTTFN